MCLVFWEKNNYANLRKCTFCMEKKNVFLGYIVSAKGIEINEKMVKKFH
jgi:hypothetical protein